MANERQFLLEYQEEGGNFYYNSMDEHHHPNTSGYRTIAICSFNECCDFSQAMNEKYDFGKRYAHVRIRRRLGRKMGGKHGW